MQILFNVVENPINIEYTVAIWTKSIDNKYLALPFYFLI